MANITFTDGTDTLTPVATQQYVISAGGLQALAGATYTTTVIDSGIIAKNTDNTGADWASGAKYITLFKGDGSKTVFPVGSEIKFKDSNGNDIVTGATGNQGTGTFRVTIDGTTYEVPIKGLAGDSGAITLGGTTTVDGHLLPSKDGDDVNDEWNIGSLNINDDPEGEVMPRRWHNLYLTGDIGASTSPIANAYITNLVLGAGDSNSPGIGIANTNDGILNSSNSGNTLPSGTIAGNPNASVYTAGGICAAQNIYGLRVFNAVFNDYAEYRTTIKLDPGHVVVDQDDGSLVCASRRLQPGAQVISDTFGHCMGQTTNATTPIAVAGRVLVYTYQDRSKYHAGMAVCSAPGGTVDIMTREEIRDYPDCIVGIVSEIPAYETWGSSNVKVNGRIWIRIK